MKHNKLLLLIIGIIILGEALMTGLLPVTRGHLFSLLTLKTGPIWMAIIIYFLNYLSIDFFQSIKGYIVLKMALWYRELRTLDVVVSLSDNFGYPKCGISSNGHALRPEVTNIPQRLQEDIKLSYLQRITVWVEYVISGIILMQLFYLNLSEPTLIAFAVVYAVISVIIAALFNPRLTRAEVDVQQNEASYRTGLVANIVDIAGMDLANKTCLKSKWIQTEYLLFTKLQLGLVAVLPYALLLPKLIDGSMDLGQVVEHQATFALIVVNAAVLIQLYPTLIQGNASESRVKEII